MCMQDLELGRGRQIGMSGTITNTPGGANVIPANANRVALILSSEINAVGTPILLCSDSQGFIQLLSIYDNNPFPVVLRIEDVGELITRQIYGGGQATGNTVRWTEIISQVPYKTIP